MNRKLANAMIVVFAALSAPALAGDNKAPVIAEKPGISNGQSTLKFVKQHTQGWQPGDYRAEVWVGEEKVNDERFDIVSTRSARK